LEVIESDDDDDDGFEVNKNKNEDEVDDEDDLLSIIYEKNNKTEKQQAVDSQEYILLPNGQKIPKKKPEGIGFEVEELSEKEEKVSDETKIIDNFLKQDAESGTNLEVLKNEDFLMEQENMENFDPTKTLSNYNFPPLSLLEEHKTSKTDVSEAELLENRNKIVDTLKNYKIEITKIKATVGPTVTLYEIIPAPGVRISKIKNLEDDIALSLAALGIRIIAPMPGRGTIGIEVPNKNPAIVSMKSVLSSVKFQKSDYELPIAIGKTISNETYVFDLTKMPHLLIAGATGQGKSVGLNAILASLLYKKHPAYVKFVMVDPKKVELTLYETIEKHFLAKLPDEEEAIITENRKVVNTLNSLNVEMDNRYQLL
jgi:S-DNA-T family DNA segregation ATPase FtsK/SpoIIIE